MRAIINSAARLKLWSCMASTEICRPEKHFQDSVALWTSTHLPHVSQPEHNGPPFFFALLNSSKHHTWIYKGSTEIQNLHQHLELDQLSPKSEAVVLHSKSLPSHHLSAASRTTGGTSRFPDWQFLKTTTRMTLTADRPSIWRNYSSGWYDSMLRSTAIRSILTMDYLLATGKSLQVQRQVHRLHLRKSWLPLSGLVMSHTLAICSLTFQETHSKDLLCRWFYHS